MHSSLRWIALAACSAVLVGTSFADDLLGKGKGGGGGSGGGSQSGGGSVGPRGGGGGSSQSGGGGNQGPRGGGGGNSSGGSNSGGGFQGGVSNNAGGSVQLSGPGDRSSGRNGNQSGRNQGTVDLSRKQSRSGNVQYGSQNNVGSLRWDNNGYTRGNAQLNPLGTSLRIGGAPINQPRPSNQNVVVRQDKTQLIYNGWRYGYYSYDSRWSDDYFYYPYYSFVPTNNNCVISPWYYYSNLPGYLSYNRVRTWSVPGIVFVGYPYECVLGNTNNYGGWNSGHDRNYRYSDVDYAAQDLESVFVDHDRRSINRLVPRRGDVSIFVDGRYSYAVNSDDFYDLLLDNSQNTQTRRYIIENSWRNNDGARIIARHEFIDPSGNLTTVWHDIILSYERNDLVVRQFGVSNFRP